MEENSPVPLWEEMQNETCHSDQIYEKWSNALLEWSVKKVPLPIKVEVFLKYKLARYGMGKIFVRSEQTASDVDWLAVAERTTVILDSVQLNTTKPLVEQLDNEFLLRLRLIHAELLGLTAVIELQPTPIAEMVFCLAVLLLSIQDEAKYGFFKLLLTPMDMLLFLRAIVSSIRAIKSRTGLNKYRKQFRKLRKLHSQMEELYNFIGARLDLMAVYNTDDESFPPKPILPQTISRLERVLKCEDYLIPGLAKLVAEIAEGLHQVIGICEETERFCNSISFMLPLLKVLIELSLFVRLRLAYQKCLTTLRQCKSLQQIRYFCRYIGNISDISEYHQMLLSHVTEFYSHVCHFTSEEGRENITSKINIIRNLASFSISKIHNKLIQFTSIDESKSNLKSIVCSLQLDLTSSIDKITLSLIQDLWSNTDPEINFLKTLQIIPPEVHEANVHSYFPPVFQGPPFNSFTDEANSMRKPINFDSSIHHIKYILKQCGCSTVENVVENFQFIPLHVITQLYCWLSRCFDHIRSLDLLVDDAELMKSGHEMIFGKTFYNFLCTDDPSYLAMVKDCDLNVVLCSLLLTEEPYETFCFRKLHVIDSDLKDIRVVGLEWVNMQKELLCSLLNENDEKTRTLISQGANPYGEFYYSLGKYRTAQSHGLKHIIANNIIKSFKLTGCEDISFVQEIQKELNDQERKATASLKLGNYKAFSYLKSTDSLERDFYNWDTLIPVLIRAGTKPELWNQEAFSSMVEKLTEHANLQSLKTLLMRQPYFIPSDQILVKAVQSGCEEIFQLLLSRRDNVGEVVIFAGIGCHMNRPLEPFILQMNGKSIFEALLIVVKVNNTELVEFICQQSELWDSVVMVLPKAIQMNRLKVIEIILDSDRHIDLNPLLLIAVTAKRWNIVKLLVRRGVEELRSVFISSLNLHGTETVSDFVTSWCCFLQKLKFLPYLRHLTSCQSLRQDLKALQQIYRQYANADWCIKEFGLVIDDNRKLKMGKVDEADLDCVQYFEDLENRLKNRPKILVFRRVIHVFNSVGKCYAHIEIHQCKVLESTALEIIFTDKTITVPMIKYEFLNQLIDETFMSCSITIFYEGKIQKFELLQLGFSEFSVELHISRVEKATENILTLMVKSCGMPSGKDLVYQIGKVKLEDIWLDPKLVYILLDTNEISVLQKRALLELFHKYGMNFCAIHSEFNLSAAAYALTKGFEGIAKKMVIWSCDGLQEPKQLVMIIQQGSIEVFELYFQMYYSEKNQKNMEKFILISNALQELYVKQVFIEEKLQIYLWFMLSEYGFNNLCTDLKASIEKNFKNNPKNIVDLKKSEKRRNLFELIDRIIKVIRPFQFRKDRKNILAINNEILFQYRMLHKYLFLVKDEKDLSNLPLKQMTFILAVFLSTFNDSEDWNESNSIYRIVLNKRAVVRLLKFIAGQLEQFIRQNQTPEIANADCTQKTIFIPEFTKKDLKKRNQIMKLYNRVKQMYSLRKLYLILKHFKAEVDSKEVTVASIKRFNQIFGECIKSTSQSQNLPKKLMQILDNQLCDYSKTIRKTRDITCHDYPLGRKFISLDDQFLYYSFTDKYLEMIKITVAMLMILTCHEYSRWLFGTLRTCNELDKIKSFIRFFGDQNAIKMIQKDCFNIIEKHQNGLIKALNSVSKKGIEPEKEEALQRLKANFSKRTEAVQKLGDLINSSFQYDYDEIQIVAFSVTKIEDIHRLLDINLIPMNDIKILDFIENNWNVLADDSYFLMDVLDSPETGVGLLITTLNRFEINQEVFHENYCQEELQRIMEYFNVEEDSPSNGKKPIIKKLAESLKPYFRNIFSVDNKMRGIKQVLGKLSIEKFEYKMSCFRRDEIEGLQTIIRTKQRSINMVLETYSCSSVHLLTHNFKKIPQNALLAIEYWLLELCEILIATERFQDNFYSIKHDLQMICGRNFRNYLAHDGLSYNILTCSSHLKVLINALVMAGMNWDIFTQSKTEFPEGIIDSSVEGEQWLKQQQNLATAVLQLNFIEIKKAIAEGALVSGRFWMPGGDCEGLSMLKLSEIICFRKLYNLQKPGYNVEKVMKLIDTSHAEKLKSCSLRELTSSMALRNSDFRSAFRNLDGKTWGQLIKSNLSSPSFYPCLGSLLLYLDEHKQFNDILDLFSIIDSKYAGAALSVRSNETLRFILDEIPCKQQDVQMHSIFMHKPLGFLVEIIGNRSLGCNYIEYTVMSNNFTFFTHILKSAITVDNMRQFENIFHMCARLGRLIMINAILNSIKVSQETINLALKIATFHQRWRTVSYLLEKGAKPWARIPSEKYNAGEMAIVMCNLKVLEKFLTVLPVPFKSSYLLSGAAKYGTTRLVKLLLKAGCDQWQNNRMLLNVKDNKRDKMMSMFVEKTIFEYAPVKHMDRRLVEWIRMIHEYKIIQNYKGYMPQFLEDCNYAKKVFKKFIKLGKTDDGYSVCDIDTIIMNVSYIQCLESFTNIDHNIQRLSPTGTPSKLQLHIEYQYDASKLTIQADLEIFNFKSNIETLLLTSVHMYKTSPTTICCDLIRLIDKQIESSAIVGHFKFQNQHYRFLRLGCCCYCAQIEQENIAAYIKSIFNSTEPNKATIMHKLPTNIDVEILQILLSTGLDPTLPDSKGRNPLILMLSVGCSWKVLEFMLEYCDEMNVRSSEGIHIFDMTDPEGRTFLSYAVAHGQSQVVERLLALGVNQNVHDKSGKFPIQYAIVARDVSIVKALIKNAPHVVNTQNIYSKETPLFTAVECNNGELVRLLLKAGSDIKLKDSRGDTVVAIAIIHESNLALDILLNHAKREKIDALHDITTDSSSALHYALIKDNVDTFKIILEHLVESRIGREMTREALFKMKEVLLCKYDEGINVFVATMFSGKIKIQSYLESCEELFKDRTNESLQEKGIMGIITFMEYLYIMWIILKMMVRNKIKKIIGRQ